LIVRKRIIKFLLEVRGDLADSLIVILAVVFGAFGDHVTVREV